MSQTTEIKKKRARKSLEKSPELIQELKGLTNEAQDLDKKITRINDIAKSEGFKEKDVISMVSAALEARYNRNQIYYILHKEKIKEKSQDNYNKKSSTNSVNIQQNDDKKDIEESTTGSQQVIEELQAKNSSLETELTSLKATVGVGQITEEKVEIIKQVDDSELNEMAEKLAEQDEELKQLRDYKVKQSHLLEEGEIKSDKIVKDSKEYNTLANIMEKTKLGEYTGFRLILDGTRLSGVIGTHS